MNREEFIRVAIQVSTWAKGTIPFRAAFDQLIAEFDRLNEINTNQSNLINNMGKRGATLQSQLDKISEPYSQARYNFDLEGIENSLHGRGYWYSAKSLRAIRDYLGSQKPSEKQHTYSHWYRRDEFHFDVHEGKPEDCPMCNPKPLTQCPECHGTKYINRVVSCADWELHPIYVIATCLNCKGEGVI